MPTTHKVTLPSGVTVTIVNPDAQADVGRWQDRDAEGVIGFLAHGYAEADRPVKVEQVVRP